MTATRSVTVTPASLRVLHELLRDGASDHVIADRLGLSYRTVRWHLSEIYTATDTHDRCALAVAVMRGRIRVYTERQEVA